MDLVLGLQSFPFVDSTRTRKILRKSRFPFICPIQCYDGSLVTINSAETLKRNRIRTQISAILTNIWSKLLPHLQKYRVYSGHATCHTRLIAFSKTKTLTSFPVAVNTKIVNSKTTNLDLLANQLF